MTPLTNNLLQHFRIDIPRVANNSSGEPEGQWALSTYLMVFLNRVPNPALPINVNSPIELNWTAYGNTDRKLWLYFGKLNFRNSLSIP